MSDAEYKHYVFIRPELLKSGWIRDRIIEEIIAAGVPCYQGNCAEVYLEKAFDNTPWRPVKRLPNAAYLGEVSLMFLVHPTLSSIEMDMICREIDRVLSKAMINWFIFAYW